MFGCIEGLRASQSFVFYCTVLSCVVACCSVFHCTKLWMSNWFPIKA